MHENQLKVVKFTQKRVQKLTNLRVRQSLIKAAIVAQRVNKFGSLLINIFV